MPRKTSVDGNENKGGAKAPAYEKLVSFEILRAREGTTATGKPWQLCDVKINGVTIYGCRAVTHEDRDFLAFPEQKGNDGKYYKHAYIPLSPEDAQKICDAIWSKLDGK